MRLDRLIARLLSCQWSVHDLSRVGLSRGLPRFNMPFELGIVVGLQRCHPRLKWFVLESKGHRLERTLNDLNGIDPVVYGAAPRGLLRELRDAFSSAGGAANPDLETLEEIHQVVREEAARLKKTSHKLFGAHSFHSLVAAGQLAAAELRARRRAKRPRPARRR